MRANSCERMNSEYRMGQKTGADCIGLGGGLGPFINPVDLKMVRTRPPEESNPVVGRYFRDEILRSLL